MLFIDNIKVLLNIISNGMKIFFWLIAIVLLFLIQQGILVPLGLGLINSVLVFLVVFAIFGDLKELIILAVLAGLLFDFYSGLSDGIFVLTFVIIPFLIHFLLANLLAREANRLIIFLSVISASILFFLFPFLFNWLLNFINLSKEFDQTSLIKNLVYSTFFNLLIIFPALYYYKFFDSLSKKLFNAK